MARVTTYSPYEVAIWNGLVSYLGNEYGVAGLMGNLYAESYLIPYIVQNDRSPYTVSQEYTNNVDSGVVSEYSFCHSNNPIPGYAKGYGLAQWTSSGRKQNLYNIKRNSGLSIGSLDVALQMLEFELDGSYASTKNVLINATSIREASDYVLHHFEAPADQSEAVELRRFSYAQDYYNLYAGQVTPPNPPGEGYYLTVVGGSASGNYNSGETVFVRANTSVGFLTWTADGSDITFSDPLALSPSFVMPARDATVTANYQTATRYRVEVINGYGTGAYAPGTLVTIGAPKIYHGKRFTRWIVVSGGIQLSSYTRLPSTFTMPHNNVVIRPVYGGGKKWIYYMKRL